MHLTERSPVEKEAKMTWDDLVFLSKQSWGLRYTSSLNEAKNELKNGFTGDGISLSSPNKLIPAKILKELDSRNIPTDALAFSTLANLFTEGDKQKILSDYETSVKKHIETGIGMSIYSIGEGKIAEELLDLLISKKSAFYYCCFPRRK